MGKIVMREAAEHLTPVLLELGGQNPAIVDETANLHDAARKLVANVPAAAALTGQSNPNHLAPWARLLA